MKLTTVFLAGCLQHLPLLEVILGHPAPVLEDARLTGFALHWGDEECAAILCPAEGAATPGLLAHLSDEDLARIDYFQGSFGLHLAEIAVETKGKSVPAQVFLPAPEGAVGAPWSFADWQVKWADYATALAVEAMGWYGRLGSEGLRIRLRGIKLRAWARVEIASHPARAGRDVKNDVKMTDHHYAYMHYFGFEEALLQFRRYDGTMSEPMPRSCLATGRASVILPYDPVRDTVLLVEQFRAPLYLAGDPAPWLWEPVAGMIDPGETPEQAALREAEEEAGLTIRRLEKVGEAYSSSGSSMEYCHLFVGLADLEAAGGVGGLETEGEDIRSAVIPFAELMRGIDGCGYRDMPLLVIANWLARHRDRLRAGM